MFVSSHGITDWTKDRAMFVAMFASSHGITDRTKDRAIFVSSQGITFWGVFTNRLDQRPYNVCVFNITSINYQNS